MKLQNLADLASLILLYLEGDALALYLEMIEREPTRKEDRG